MWSELEFASGSLTWTSTQPGGPNCGVRGGMVFESVLGARGEGLLALAFESGREMAEVRVRRVRMRRGVKRCILNLVVSKFWVD